MLWTICVILLVLWLLGLVSGYTLGGVSHSRPAGHRRHCGRGPIDPGPKMIVRSLTLAGKGEVFGKRGSRPAITFPNYTIFSAVRVSQ